LDGEPSGKKPIRTGPPFQQGLRKAGLVENRDIVLDIVWIGGEPDQAVTEFARELLHSERTVGYLWHPGWADGENRYQTTEQAAQSAGMQLRSRGILDGAELHDAVAAIKNSGATTLIVQPSPFTFRLRDRIIETAMGHRLATIFGLSIAAREGGLIGYGPDQIHMYQMAPFYVDQILKGMKPSDLPVEQPTKIGLVINLKTAKTLGLDVPLALLVRADELIE
jgi:putative ABC transport system substrate-binding protein